MAAEEKKEGKMDTKAMMDLYVKLGTPGAPHELLRSLEGKWTTRTRAWMETGAPPVESTGTCEQEMILEGRFLRQEYKGEMMGGLFTGINTVGYDNHAGKFVSTWIDSMSTGIYYFEGSARSDGRTIAQECRYDDPVRGPSIWRSVMKIVDGSTVVYEAYLGEEGKEEKMMEMTLIRKD